MGDRAIDDHATALQRWQGALRDVVADRDVILAGGPLAGFPKRVDWLRRLGARRFLCIARGVGTGPIPEGEDVETVLLDDDAPDIVADFRAWERTMAAPPAVVADGVAAFDPRGEALLLFAPFQAAAALGDRPAFGARRPEWVALEDKTRADALFDRAGVARPPARIVAADAGALRAAAAELDERAGTVWAGDASRGFNGGTEYVRWVRANASDDDIAAAVAFFAERCDRVRVAPFVEGIPCSAHGFVTADGIAVFRPVELVNLRPRAGVRLQYAGAATFWDPSPEDRDAIRTAVRKVGEVLRDEVGFRGAYTVDGILARDGWLPTECNPRYGAALGYAGMACPELPLDLLHHLVIEDPSAVRAAELEAVVLAAGDSTRAGAGWSTVATKWDETLRVAVVLDGGSYRAATDGETPDAFVMRGPSVVGGFVRVELPADRVAAGPSVAPLVAAGLAFADAAFGAGIGPLTAPVDVRR